MPRLCFLLLLLLCSCRARQTEVIVPDDTAMTGLLSLLDSIAVRNAGHDSVALSLATLSPDTRARMFLALQERNAADQALQRIIDDLLNSEPYRLYFGRFTNVTRENFRVAFNAIPYAVPDLPGGIAEPLYDLFHHRHEFGEWYRKLKGEIDMRRCVRLAREWLPGGEYALQKVYFIYDGNAGSFAERGSAFFNFCSEIMRTLPGEEGFAHLEGVGIAAIEGVIAHELHHVMAEPILYRRASTPRSWKTRWTDRITRGIVGEGVAFQCNPPSGLQKSLWEDRATLRVLLRELNRILLAMEQNRVEEAEVSRWYGRLFHDFAASLLRHYLERAFPDSSIGPLAVRYASIRPDLEHALGWWMVSRIAQRRAEKDDVLRLLTEPASVYQAYNESLSPDMADLAVDPRVVAVFAAQSAP